MQCLFFFYFKWQNGREIHTHTHCDGRQHSTRAELIYRSTVGGNFVFPTMKEKKLLAFLQRNRIGNPHIAGARAREPGSPSDVFAKKKRKERTQGDTFFSL